MLRYPPPVTIMLFDDQVYPITLTHISHLLPYLDELDRLSENRTTWKGALASLCLPLFSPRITLACNKHTQSLQAELISLGWSLTEQSLLLLPLSQHNQCQKESRLQGNKAEFCFLLFLSVLHLWLQNPWNWGEKPKKHDYGCLISSGTSRKPLLLEVEYLWSKISWRNLEN